MLVVFSNTLSPSKWKHGQAVAAEPMATRNACWFQQASVAQEDILG